MPGAAVRSNARSAPSSTCRGANPAAAAPTMSSASCARTTSTASTGSSSLMAISRATRTGSRSSTVIIKLREQDGMDVRFLIQVDTMCHKMPNFVAKAKRAGITRIFIGLENINPDNLLAAKKRQNKITEYRDMLLAWKAAGIWTYAGYILGFPNDTPESARRDIEIIKKEMPLDVLEFFFL